MLDRRETKGRKGELGSIRQPHQRLSQPFFLSRECDRLVSCSRELTTRAKATGGLTVTATLAAGQFQDLARHLAPRQVSEILSIDLSEVESWLKSAPTCQAVPRWACRLLALETGQRLTFPSPKLQSVPYIIDPDAVAWLVHTERLRTHANNWHNEADQLDTAGHKSWFTPEGEFCLPIISQAVEGFTFSNGRHRSVILSRFLDAIPVGVIGNLSEDELWPLAVRRLEPGERVLVPIIPLHKSISDYGWQPSYRR